MSRRASVFFLILLLCGRWAWASSRIQGKTMAEDSQSAQTPESTSSTQQSVEKDNETPDLDQARAQWLAGMEEEAARFGCDPELIQQQPGESVAEAIQVYRLAAKAGSCLILQPISTDPGTMRYSFASGGKVDGVEILYISDVPQVRIKNGAAVGN